MRKNLLKNLPRNLALAACCLAALAQEARALEAGAAGGEEKLRQRFVAVYTAAQTVDARCEAVALLKGARERATQRLLAGMLGDKDEAVRKAACAAIVGTPDKDGYFVKPLIGALADSSGGRGARAAAANALAHAEIKADAVKALVFTLLDLSGEKAADDGSKPEDLSRAGLIAVVDRALAGLCGTASAKRDMSEISAFWLGYWKQHEEALRAADDKKLAVAPPSREGMAPDSFDVKKP